MNLFLWWVGNLRENTQSYESVECYSSKIVVTNLFQLYLLKSFSENLQQPAPDICKISKFSRTATLKNTVGSWANFNIVY